MLNKTCPICGKKSALSKDEKKFTATYANTGAEVSMPVMVCSCCVAKFEMGKTTDK